MFDLSFPLYAEHILTQVSRNVDMSTAIVYRPINIIEFAMMYLNLKDISQLMRLNPGDKDWKSLKAALKGVRVNVLLQKGTRKMPPRPIKDLIYQGGHYQFTVNNETWTVEVCVHCILHIMHSTFTKHVYILY